MSGKNPRHHCLLWSTILLALCTFSSFYLKPAVASPFPQAQKKEPLSEASKQWLEEVVPYIITQAEKELFLSLPNEAERGKFIENFWKKRDPKPETPENEFKIAYYRRIAFANKFFGVSSIPGWKTDRGRVFILLGPPNEIQNDYLSSRESISQPGAVKQIWTYWNLPNPNLPYSFEFTFVDRYGTGNYELETSFEHRDNASFPVDLEAVHQYFNQMEILAEAMRNPWEKAEKLRGLITTQVNYDLVPFSCDVFSRKGSAEKAQAILYLTIPVRSLESRIVDGKTTYSLTLMLSLSNELGQSLMEKTQEVSFERDLAKDLSPEASKYFLPLSLPLAPGNYGLHLLLLDNFSGKIGTIHKQASIPNFSSAELTISDILLSSASPASQANRQGFSSLSREFKSETEMHLEFEVYNVTLESTTKKGRLTVKLFFYRGNDLIANPPPLEQEVEATTDCLVQTSLRLRSFPPGEYRLRIEVTDEVAALSCWRETSFRVIQP
jgi:GWxTD domain-containing protein